MQLDEDPHAGRRGCTLELVPAEIVPAEPVPECRHEQDRRLLLIADRADDRVPPLRCRAGVEQRIMPREPGHQDVVASHTEVLDRLDRVLVGGGQCVLGTDGVPWQHGAPEHSLPPSTVEELIQPVAGDVDATIDLLHPDAVSQQYARGALRQPVVDVLRVPVVDVHAGS